MTCDSRKNDPKEAFAVPRERTKRKVHAQRKTSVAATILFIVFSCFTVYGAIRWMGGTVVRFLSAPDVTGVPEQTPSVQHVAESEAALFEGMSVSATPEVSQQSAKNGNENHTEPKETPWDTPQAVPQEPESDMMEEAVRETGNWQGERYSSMFQSGCMDLLLVLTDDNDGTAAMCALALRENETVLLAIPSNTVMDDGTVLSAYPPKTAVQKLNDLLPVAYEYYLAMPISLLTYAADVAGPLQIVGRSMDCAAITTYFSEAENSPLLRAERFSHVLCVLPEKVRSFSGLKLFRMKGELEETVKTNLSESEGWMLFNALRKVQTADITEHTLPVESVMVAGERGYRPNNDLSQTLLKKIYESSGKSCEKTS